MEVNTADGDMVAYEYDDENIRVSFTVNGTKTTYLDENLKVRYVHGLDLISVERDGEVSVYLVDGLRSTRTLTDLDGEVVATYTYDAFGELLGSMGDIENDYLFAGEQFDGELEQYYLRQRFYEPGIGFSEMGGVNHYQQVFQQKFPDEIANGTLKVVHVPGNVM